MKGRCCTCRWFEESDSAGDFGLCLETMAINDRPHVERLTLVEEKRVALTDRTLVAFDGWCGDWEPADRAACENGE